MHNRRKITLLLIVLGFFFTAHSQWEWLNPKPSGYACSRIFFADAQKGFVLSANGDLNTTINQGLSWEFKRNFPNALSMDFKDSTAAISGFGGTFYISKDSGNTWQLKNVGTFDYFSFVDVVSSDTIFLATTNGKIMRTYNGGNSWQSLSCGIQISSIEFINSKVGYAGGSSRYILKTEDGGATWQQNVTVNVVPSNTLAIKFVDINTGFAFREHSTLLRTTDGGITWASYNIGDDIYSFHFLSKTVGFACGEHGVMYRTSDGGVSWQWMSPDVRIYDYDLQSIYFINPSIGFAVGRRGRILKTVNGGTTWTTYSPTYIDVRDISIPVKSTAYATVGNKIYKTVDTGNTWQPLALTVGTEYAEHDVFQKCHFFTADTGFVTASDQARVYKTYNGGATWKLIQPTQYGYDHVTDVQFLDKNKGYLAIYIYSQGILVKTIDGGETWTPIWSAQFQGEYFQKIFFVDEKTGYGSRNNRLYKTIDSARTWTQLWEGEVISSLWFTSPKTGFACGENGMLRRTIDSGRTWSQIPITNQYFGDDLYRIKFLDQRVGYFTAEGGAIYKTIDSGTTWQPWGKGSFYRLPVIQFGPDSTVHLAGQYGTILRSDAREVRMESIQVTMPTNCQVEFKARVTPVLGVADSMKYEYGISSFNLTTAANPITALQQQQITATVSNLPPSTTYKVRLKTFFQGSYHYSNETVFRTLDRPATPTIAVSGATTFCEGDSVVLTSSATSGNQWFLNGNLLPGINAQNYVAKQAGNYQLVRQVNCYTSDTASKTVVVEPTPAPPVITWNGTVLTSSAASGNQWYFNSTMIAGATGTTHTPSVGGVYSVRVTQNNCISPASSPYTYFVTSVNSPVLETHMNIGPNPVKEELVISYTGNPGSFLVIVNDAWGRPVYQQTFTKTITVDMRRYAAGTYFITIENTRSKEHLQKRIVIVK